MTNLEKALTDLKKRQNKPLKFKQVRVNCGDYSRLVLQRVED